MKFSVAWCSMARAMAFGASSAALVACGESDLVPTVGPSTVPSGWTYMRERSRDVGVVTHVAWTGELLVQWFDISVPEAPSLSVDVARGYLLRPHDGRNDRYGSDQWSITSNVGAPQARFDSSFVVSDTTIFVWGGENRARASEKGTAERTDGAAYSLRDGTWSPMRMDGALVTSGSCTAWTGSEILVWGGHRTTASGYVPVTEGKKYDPATGNWSPMASVTLKPRHRCRSVWTGDRFVVRGGCIDEACSEIADDGAIYDPVTDRWTSMSSVDAPNNDNPGVWTGTELLVWGEWCGSGRDRMCNHGFAYDVDRDRWRRFSAEGAPSERKNFARVWAGSALFVWGGSDGITLVTGGGLYDPRTDTWNHLDDAGSPPLRDRPEAIWTGTQIVIAGGAYSADPSYDGPTEREDGALYLP